VDSPLNDLRRDPRFAIKVKILVMKAIKLTSDTSNNLKIVEVLKKINELK
jgi:hypothetical protein